MLVFRTVPLLFVVLATGIHASSQQKAPHLSLKDIHGKRITLSAYKGKVVLLNFWATWCVPCRTEIPDLVKKQREYRDQGLRIIGITYPPQRVSHVRSFARKLKMNYPVVIGTKETKRAFTPSETLPLTIVIDREGNIQGMIEGIMYADEFEQKVMPVIRLRESVQVVLPEADLGLTPKAFANSSPGLERQRQPWVTSEN